MSSAIRNYAIVRDFDILAKKAVPHLVSQMVRRSRWRGQPSRYAGIAVEEPKFKWAPFYEEALIRGLRQVLEEGDSVVVVGGGRGVSTIKAARLIGDTGTVSVYEGAEGRINTLRRTLQLNEAPAEIRVHHSVVGEEDTTAGDPGGAGRVDPLELPEMDVLEMDCEGAELNILRRFQELSNLPRSVVVETHGAVGSTPEKVTELLEELGYRVENVGVEKRSTGVYVLTGTRTEQ